MLRALRYAVRQLRHSRGFAVIAILTLTLGIGATTVIFSILDAVLLEPLPFPQSDHLIAITARPWNNVSVPTALDWQQRSHSLSSIAAYRGWSPTVRSAKGNETGLVIEVTQGFLSTLNASFFLGQDFLHTGNERDCTAQVIVSGVYWNRLGGGTNLGGRTLEIDRRTYQIAGVLSLGQPIEGPAPLDNPDILIPAGCDPSNRPDHRGSSSYEAIARLRPGVTIEQARAEIDTVQKSLRKDFPNYYPVNYEPVIQPWKDLVAGEDTRSALYATLAACILLLLIACANLANLLLARNTRRRHEFATRATLGASLGQLLSQLLVESALLSGLGAVSGIALAAFALRLLRQRTIIRIPRLAHAAIHTNVLAFVVVAFILITILLTLLPARRTLQPSLLRDLSAGGRASGGRSLRRAGRLLVVAQLTLTMVLVASAGWMVASVLLLLHQPLGFDPTRLLIAGVDVHGSSITPTYDAAHTNQFFTQMSEELSHQPGVIAVAAVNHYPLGGFTNRFSFCADVHPEDCNQLNTHAPDNFHVTPGYFATIGQTLYAGSDFTASDDGRRHVAIVNRALAAQEWPGQNPLGKRLYTGDIHDWATVIGVVGDVHNFDLSSPPVPNLYLPEADNPQTAMAFVLRTSGDPEVLAHEVRETIHRLYPDLALYRLESMEHRMSRQVEERRFLMWMASAFGLLSLLIAVLGTYGLLAYEISLREKEIGIRIALGSSREGVMSLLLREESRWILVGASAGLLCAALTGYLLRSQFYGASSTSLPVLLGSAALLVVTGLGATVLPAHRAAHLDPVQALRSD
jgi:predicted permease